MVWLRAKARICASPEASRWSIESVPSRTPSIHPAQRVKLIGVQFDCQPVLARASQNLFCFLHGERLALYKHIHCLCQPLLGDFRG